MDAGPECFEVGELRRREAAELIVGYSFDLQNNRIAPRKLPNPGAGREHVFRAWRLNGTEPDPVTMRDIPPEALALEVDDEITDE